MDKNASDLRRTIEFGKRDCLTATANSITADVAIEPAEGDKNWKY
jgi:hypothetical protein